MKTKLLYLLFLSIPTAMAYEMEVKGANLCTQNNPYFYEAIMRRDKDDKKKGKLEKTTYEWFLPGFIVEAAYKDSPIAKVYTPKVEVFDPDPKKWPTALAACNGKTKWQKYKILDIVSSNRINVTIAPQQIK